MRRRLHQNDAAETLHLDLAALPDLSPDVLKQRWREQFDTPAPLRISRQLMIRAIAHRLQTRALGSLSLTARRRLARATEELARGNAPAPHPGRIKAGTRLLREWQGTTHEVIVLEDGVQYRGQRWRSLSAVAREITGARWSGPLFFGLKARRNEAR